MKLHLTRKGRQMFSPNEDNIPVHWFALTKPQKCILEALYNKTDVPGDEVALQLLIDIKLVKYD